MMLTVVPGSGHQHRYLVCHAALKRMPPYVMKNPRVCRKACTVPAVPPHVH